MVITELEKKSRNRTALYVDGVIRVWLNDDIVFQYALSVGDEITEEELERFIKLNDETKAKEKALSLLDRRDHSASELRQKLIRSGIDGEVAERVICRLIECGIVDDERFAALLTDEMVDRRCYSKKRCRFELMKKGVSKETIESVLNEKCIEDCDTVYKLITAKYLRKMSDEVTRQSLSQTLLRNGFSWSDVKSAYIRFDEEYNDE